jgi:hypothetical protein
VPPKTANHKLNNHTSTHQIMVERKPFLSRKCDSFRSAVDRTHRVPRAKVRVHEQKRGRTGGLVVLVKDLYLMIRCPYWPHRLSEGLTVKYANGNKEDH